MEGQVQEEMEGSDNTKYELEGPTSVDELEVGFIFGRDQELEVNMKNVLPPSSILTNMQILDTVHAKVIKQNVSSFTLRPISYFEVDLEEQVDFKLEGTLMTTI